MAVGDVVVPVRDDTKDHRDFVDKLLRLTGDPLEQVRRCVDESDAKCSAGESLV